ncbi:transcriptional regulator [Nonomuraea sp. NPDC049646]|uniref:transcriptional regulator n=1 Tax=unclassified Nonomuraea TaxID=2593643 RepID=UPI0037B734C0
MDVIDWWTGHRASALQAALRLTCDEYAAYLGVSRRTVMNWRANPSVVPCKLHQRCLDTAHKRADVDEAARFAVILREAGQSAHATPADQEWTDDDMNRRNLLRLFTVAGAVVAAPQTADMLDLDRLSPARRSNRIDPETINQYDTLNSHLWQVFMLASAKNKIYPLVQDHLATLVNSLQRSAAGDDHRRLCALAGDAFQLAGEIFFDASRYTDAAHCYTLAASASKEAGAYDLWACAMVRHAFVGIYDRRYSESAPMLDVAARLARRGDSSLSTRHWVEVVRAEALAGLGDFDGCQRALDAAEEVRGMTGQFHNGGWLRFDGGRLAEERGTCYVTLRRPQMAEAVLSEALTHTLSTRRRGGVLVDLATLGAQQGDRDRVLDYGRAAVELARSTGSGVIGSKLRGLQRHIGSLTADQRIDVLSHDIDELATTS